MPAQTKPCEYCGSAVTKTASMQSQRKFWTCDASCANRLRIQLGHTPNWTPNPHRGQKDTRPCAECGQPVTRYLSQVTVGRDWTCSNTCAGIRRMRSRIASGAWVQPRKRKTGAMVPCEQCGTEFWRIRSNTDARFCSRVCADDAQRREQVVKACGWCGKELVLKPSQSGIQFCSRLCMGEAKIARPLEREHNGRRARLDRSGYVLVWQPDHPAPASLKGWVYEHRLVAAQMVGRPLTSEEQVDHINRDKQDNRPDNLQVLDQLGHAIKTAADQQGDRDQLAEYRKRYGPL